jgi:site-specific recombinase XerC
MNCLIFRLACCCGLRVSEIGALRLEDVCVASGRPHLRVRPEGAKGKKARVVPLWWDAATLAAGHTSLHTTSAYWHVAVDDDAVPGHLSASGPLR